MPSTQTSRADSILAAIENIVTPEAISRVFAIDKFPAPPLSLMPAMNTPGHNAFGARQTEFALGIATALRDARLCARVSNIGHHDVLGLHSWNRFLEGALDGAENELTGHDYYLRLDLPYTPLFKAIFYRLNMDGGDAIRALQSEGAEVSAAGYSQIIEQICKRIKAALSSEDDLILKISSWPTHMDHTLKFTLVGGPLRPMLAVPAEKSEHKLFCPGEAPAVARHFELSLPSGRLAMADWFRIPGFSEAVQTFCDGDDFSINYATGRDEQMRSYYEQLGFVSVPARGGSHAYEIEPGIWAMADINEDHEDLWDEDEEPTGLAPQEVWHISRAYRATTFADVEVITDILMASGQYGDRDAAAQVVEAYCAQHGNTIQSMGTDKLHIYAPTGYGYTGPFYKQFSVAEAEQFAWRRDSFLISREPLTPNPGVRMADDPWVAGLIDPKMSMRGAPEPEEAPETPDPL